MADENRGPQDSAVVGKNRIEALTDGIFAFALTVLVLNLEVPETLPVPLPPYPVQAQLLSLVPDFVHYFMAFLVLAGFWVSHHTFFSRVRSVDRTMTWLNIASLLFVALVPFSAELADTYVDYPLAAAVFELNVLIVGALYYVQWKYATRDARLVDQKAGGFADEEKRLMVMPAISLAALAVALSGVAWSPVLYAVTPVPYILLMKRK